MGNSCSCPRIKECLLNCCCCCRSKSKTSWINSNRTSSDKFTTSPMTMAPPDSIDENDGASNDALKVNMLDFNYERNGNEHHTDKYYTMNGLPAETSRLVVRRGQTFRLQIGLNRPFDRRRDTISFVFTLADDEKPSNGHGTLIGTNLNLDFYDTGESSEWACALESQHGDILDVLVKPAANAPIGEWKFDVDTHLKTNEATRSFKSPNSFFVLFNPWCRDDQVYLPVQADREEYVLSDTTLIWRGSYNRLRPSVWKLGQFDRNILECSLILLSKVGKVAPAYRGDPVKLARALSSAVNSHDDGGAVLGNWSENFVGGTAPTKWVGSVEILQSYYKKSKPVKFGQCWTFAGVLTTIARAIGLPSRVITCYSSAHDTQASLTVDYFVDETGRVMEELNSDSIWNYHVWNEVWMDRPDLGLNNGSYGGWQAVDATPQEMSDGLYRCGPASVRAVKLGEILRPYDCNFLYSEVNADKIFWRYTGPYQPLKLLRKDILGIGLLISTKSVGKWERQDITHLYKFPEKTRDERETMLKALKQSNSTFSRFYLNEEFNDIYFDFDLLNDIKIGEPFTVNLQVKNRSDINAFTVTGSLHVDSVLYTGKQRESVKSIRFERTIPPNSVEFVKMEVAFYEYYNKLLDQAAFNISCMAKVKDTDFEYFAQDDFRVRKPDIKISIQGEPVVNREVDVIVRLTNPLPIPLKKGNFQLEGPGLEKQLSFKIPEVPVSGTASATFKYIPPYAGRGTFVAKFFSKELDDVDGYLAFEVLPREEDIIYGNSIRHANNTISRRSHYH